MCIWNLHASMQVLVYGNVCLHFSLPNSLLETASLTGLGKMSSGSQRLTCVPFLQHGSQQIPSPHLVFFMDAGDSDSGLLVCTARTVLFLSLAPHPLNCVSLECYV